MAKFDETFFEAEEREGFYIESMMKRAWAAEIEVLEEIAKYCDEFLVHGVDVEGKSSGVYEELAAILAAYSLVGENKITYAGGIGCMKDLEKFQKLTRGRIDFTIGSALDLFGGILPYEKIKYYEDEVNTL